ncbi:MAG: Uma2 family endonuclease, partial [Planctomycetota bacterium]
APPITADQLLGISVQLRNHGKRCELVSGELRIMSPTGGEHGVLSARIAAVLNVHVATNGLGVCFGAETGFVVQRDPDTVKAPDAAFVKQDRIDAVGISAKYFPEAPTLAVEVVSPSESEDEVHAKAQMWIESGSEMVWVVWPEDRTVSVYRPQQEVLKVGEAETPDGGGVVPGFAVEVAELFAGLS